jgi:phosphatidylethanolamine/phosphatidyl-N-methylethanolamine N-methyltransferase
MNLDDAIRAYRVYAPAYDVLFGPIFHPGRRAAVALANDRPRQRVLEVGVGTGLTLRYFRDDATVIGIDLSPEMLAKARRRIEKRPLRQILGLVQMDALALSFPDNSFDSVLALYIASVVPDPVRLGAELRRVCVPGGRIVIVNHFTSSHGLVRRIEQGLDHHARRLGFNVDFPLEEFVSAAQLDVREILPSNIFGYWKLLRCVNSK